MQLRTILLMLLLLVTYEAGHCLDVICQIQLQLPIESTLAKELCACSVFIINSVAFDIDKSTVLSREELSRIDTIKRCNASADVLLTIVLPFNVTVLSVHQPLSERINIVLRDNVLDGVDLDYDISLLDYYEQLRYGQFLRQLRTTLSDKYVISTTIGCHTLGSSKALLKAFNEHLNLISVVGVNMLEKELVNRSKEEFMVRQYEIEYIERLRSHVGVLSYGQVCEMLREKQAKCGDDGSKRPGCSLFAGRGAVVYDSEQTVRIRTEQVHQLGVRGILILPNYDDTENVCNKVRSAMQTLDSALAYLDGIIYRALGMVERLENLEQMRREETTVAATERPWLVDELVAELLHRLYAGRARYVPYLYWYALLINGIEMMLSMYALLTQAGWDHRLKWRPLCHIPKYLRINFALVVPLLTVYSNLAAIVGLLK
uniref:GH18 domain-containing protein n=1 Tax=Anopheles christyi TaxID=43041 RepID=A0A182KA78_9DIPT